MICEKVAHWSITTDTPATQIETPANLETSFTVAEKNKVKNESPDRKKWYSDWNRMSIRWRNVKQGKKKLKRQKVSHN